MSGAVHDRPDALPRYLPAGLPAVRVDAPRHEVGLEVHDAGALATVWRALDAAHARPVTVLLGAVPEPALVAVFAIRGDLLAVRTPTGGDPCLRYPALTPAFPGMQWSERELAERRGVRPEGLPDPGTGMRLTAPDADALDPRIAGLDIFQMPFGPVRSGVFEAIQFGIETGGENVPRLTTRPFFKHRGLERRFDGLDPDTGTYVAERIAGIATVAHASAFATAVERAAGIEAPRAAQSWRAVHAELERIACHLDVVAKQAETTALSVGLARFQILKEQIMRLRAALCGSRFGRGVVVPGGVRSAGLITPAQTRAEIDAFERDLRRDERMFTGTASMTDRLITTGVLPRELIERFGAVGPLARGSGVSVDARHERPYGEYRRLGTRVVTGRQEDAMARVQVRLGEIHESLRLLRGALDQIDRRGGELRTAVPGGAGGAGGAAFGWAEAPQGELVYRVELSGGRIAGVHVASPSLRNWALFAHAFPKDVLTDFAFIEHSFGLTPAGADR